MREIPARIRPIRRISHFPTPFSRGSVEEFEGVPARLRASTTLALNLTQFIASAIASMDRRTILRKVIKLDRGLVLSEEALAGLRQALAAARQPGAR